MGQQIVTTSQHFEHRGGDIQVLPASNAALHVKDVTTPHGEIQGLLARAERNIPACGSFTKAPSEPTVGSISVGGLWALDLRHRLVHQTLIR